MIPGHVTVISWLQRLLYVQTLAHSASLIFLFDFIPKLIVREGDGFHRRLVFQAFFVAFPNNRLVFSVVLFIPLIIGPYCSQSSSQYGQSSGTGSCAGLQWTFTSSLTSCQGGVDRVGV